MAQDLKRSVIDIRDASGIVQGTGFIIGPDLAVTCAHVVSAVQAGPGQKITITFAHNPSRTYQVEVLHDGWRPTEGVDLAFLRLPDVLPQGVRSLRLGRSTWSYGHALEAFGFPASNPKGLGGYGKIYRQVRLEPDIPVLQLESKQITIGFSGGPVLDEKTGWVVGIVTAITNPDRFGRQDETAFATPSESIQEAWPSLRLKWLDPRLSTLGGGMVLLVLVVVGLSVWYLSQPLCTPSYIPLPNNAFNIAMAEFALLDANDNLSYTITSRRLSHLLFQTLNNKFYDYQVETGREINLLGPDQLCAVIGRDPVERATYAQKLAADSRATLLIYGVIRETGTGYQIESEFYVPLESFKYATEFVGRNEFGQVITISYDQLTLNDTELAEQLILHGADTVVDIVEGLHDFYRGRYDDAYRRFDRAAANNEHDEVIHLLKGAARLRAYGPKIEPTLGNQLLVEAYRAFSETVTIKPDYPRGYLGLAAVLLIEAGQVVTPTEKEALLTQAESWYLKVFSLAAADLPAANLQAKANYGLGQVYWNRYSPQFVQVPGQPCAYHTAPPDPAAAKARFYFDEVIKGYNNSPAADLAWFAGHAHAGLGWLEGSQGNWAAMSSQYKQAIHTLDRMATPPDDWIAYYWRGVAEAERCQSNLAEACLAFERAITTARKVADSDQTGAFDLYDLDTWQAQFNQYCQKGP